MGRNSRQRFDVLVVGGGPAGIAAGARAAECGARVGVVDDNPVLGGQIWRAALVGTHDKDAVEWSSRLQAARATTLGGLRVFHQPETGTLWAEATEGVQELRYEKLILATGARERFLPFPGWTLPNVMGAGGLQAMVKSGLPIRGKRVVVAGTGPLLLAVAAYLRKHSAEITMICEQASWSSLAAFAATLAVFSGKISQAWQLRKDIAGIPFAANCWTVAAHGERHLESVTVSRGGQVETMPCDYLACGFHLVPNVEMPALLGCQISGGFVQVDDFQQTSVKGVFCAGEPTSIGGVELALIEGQISGLAAVGETRRAETLFGKRRRARRFARLLDRTFQLRPELKNLLTAETIVCRCEDVRYSCLQSHASWRAAKLQTRCGMGPCQGRICGPATEFLFGWKPDSTRPPIFPARVESLAADVTSQSESQLSVVPGGPA